MKTKLLFLYALFLFQITFSQTDGWYLYNKPGTVSAIVPDDSNANILHIATDMGYIQYNTSTDMVADFLNLTSQNPAIGNVNGIDVNPTNNDIALALDVGFAIYDGTTVTVYTYDNSDLTIGSVGGSQFTKLKVRYGRLGQLYIFKPDATGYQLFNNGVFDTEVVTSFKPQDIVENNAGTKAFFAGPNNGVWELDKATSSLINYTTSNSDLSSNFINALMVDSSDNLFIGHYQGLDRLESNGTITTCNATSPIPVFDIDINPANGELLVLNSIPNSASRYGFSLVNYDSCSWTNYTNDASNCLDDDVFNAAAFGGDNNIYVAKNSFPFNGEVFKFISGTDACTQLDINYLNAPTVTTSNFISGIATRTKALNVFDIGFIRGENLHMIEINQGTFSGAFPKATTITPSPGNAAYSLLDDNDFFIVETNTGWVFVDGNNNVSEFVHNLPGYAGILTQKAAAYDSENGIVNLVHKGFDASWNYRVYKTQCNTATGTCTPSEEIFATNRDMAQNVLFDCTTLNGVITCYGIKSASSGGGSSRGGGDFREELDNWNEDGGGDEPGDFDRQLPPDMVVNKRPIAVNVGLGGINLGVPVNITINIRDDNNGNPFFTPFPIDIDNNGVEDLIKSVSPQEFIPGFVNSVAVIEKQETSENGTFFQFGLIVPLSGNFSLSPDFDLGLSFHDSDVIFSDIAAATMARFGGSGFRVSQEDPVKTTFVLLTNHGIIINSGVEISSDLLNTNNITLKEKSLLLYPNPANNMVSFSNKTISKIEVFDINGRRVLQKTGSSFSVNTLAKGVYVVKGRTSNNITISKKLIVN